MHDRTGGLMVFRMNKLERWTRLLCITVSASLVLAGCRNAGDWTRSEAALRFRTTDEVLRRGVEILRKTLDDPRTLQEHDSLLQLEAPFLDPRFGVAADYAVWRDYRLRYEAATDSIYDLERLGLEQRTVADPLVAPAVMDEWARKVETAGSPTELMARALEAADIPWPETVSLSAHGSAVDAINASALMAHRILDEEMLGALGPDERALLGFLVQYVSVTGGTYQPMAFDTPTYYWMGWTQPEWTFDPGSSQTPLGVTVPDGLPSMTSIYRFYRSLAGKDTQIPILSFPPTEKEWGGEHALFTGLRVDLSATARAFTVMAPLLEPAFLKRLERELRTAATQAHEPVPGVEGEVLLHRETKYGNLIIGGPGANRYTTIKASVIIDVGGDDTYETDYDIGRLGRYPLRIVIDLHGNDVYSHRQAVGPGAGVFGLGILLDQEGNDIYAQGVDPERGRARQALLSESLESGVRWVDPARVYGGDPPASLDGGFSFGASFFGIGLHLDRAGDDTYLVDKWALGAASGPGFGVLADESGDDWYIAAIQSVGTGFNKGVGILRDAGKGKDRYQSWGVYRSSYTYRVQDDSVDAGYEGFGIGVGSGWRSEAGSRWWKGETVPTNRQAFVGGIGLVTDDGGDDVYVGSTFGLGVGYTAGIGMLVDGSGDDAYVAMKGKEDHGGFAEGVHHGTGFLLDRAGNDFYSGGCASGAGWDLGIGYFIDISGDDHYTDLWKLGFKPGASPVRSLGVFLDGSGLDTLSDFTTDLANASEFYPNSYHPLIGGNFSFVLLLGPERDRLPPALAETVRGPVTLTSVSFGEEEDGKQYPRGIGVVLIESAGRRLR